ncbi:uncharacterized protein PAC_00063 [Phialocephala subalpina]|uniref:Uncharacterized protein n=1 Tax=Phialocephala subalpina TaxID=576137 RepID=A0A1L7WBP5_9HELO|nr:uncharacterized protein PAC_00063 [Phialocephala subalpina]
MLPQSPFSTFLPNATALRTQVERTHLPLVQQQPGELICKHRLLYLQRTSRENVQKMVKVVVPLGCMAPAAIASPMLFEYRTSWLVDVLVFFVSTGAFVAQHAEEMKIYGPFTLAFATFLGLAAYSSARTPLPELIPWMPLVVWSFVMLTVYFLPKVHGFFVRPILINPENAMEEGRYEFPRFPAEAVHSYPDLRIHSGGGNLEMMTLLDHALTGIDPYPACGLMDGLSSHESDIDLQEQPEAVVVALRRGVSIARAGFFTGGLSESSSDGPYPQNLGTAVQNGQFRNSESDIDSPSSDSIAVSVPSTTVESSMPLLG